MKRVLASAAAAGLLTFGLAACGGEDEPAEDPGTEQEETPADTGTDSTADEPDTDAGTSEAPAPEDGSVPADPGMTTAPPDGMGETGAAPDPEAAQFCDTFAELQTAPETEVLAGFQGLADVAPEEIRGDLDAVLAELEGLTEEELQGTEIPEGVDEQVLNESLTNIGAYTAENCAP